MKQNRERLRSQKAVIGIDTDDIENLEDVLKVVLIDGKCGNLKILIDGGKLTRNINQKKKLDVLQGLHSVTNTAGESISSISN